MYSFNTSEAEIIAIRNVLRVDIVMLTHKIQGRERTFEERTEWKRFGFNPDLNRAVFLIFCLLEKP